MSRTSLQKDNYHKGEEQGPTFERLKIDIQHLAMGFLFIIATIIGNIDFYIVFLINCIIIIILFFILIIVYLLVKPFVSSSI